MKKTLSATTDKGVFIRLRSLSVQDVERCLAWMSNREITRYITAQTTMTLEKELTWIRVMNRSKKDLVSAIEMCDAHGVWKHIGNVGMHHIDWDDSHAELGIIIGEVNAHGKGIGTAALTLIRDYAFKEIDLFKVYARVYSSNAASMKMCEKAGLVLEGIEKYHVLRDDVRLHVHTFAAFRDTFDP